MWILFHKTGVITHTKAICHIYKQDTCNGLAVALIYMRGMSPVHRPPPPPTFCLIGLAGKPEPVRFNPTRDGDPLELHESDVVWSFTISIDGRRRFNPERSGLSALLLDDAHLPVCRKSSPVAILKQLQQGDISTIGTREHLGVAEEFEGLRLGGGGRQWQAARDVLGVRGRREDTEGLGFASGPQHRVSKNSTTSRNLGLGRRKSSPKASSSRNLGRRTSSGELDLGHNRVFRQCSVRRTPSSRTRSELREGEGYCTFDKHPTRSTRIEREIGGFVSKPACGYPSSSSFVPFWGTHFSAIEEKFVRSESSLAGLFAGIEKNPQGAKGSAKGSTYLLQRSFDLFKNIPPKKL
ncbi:orotidine 5'-phosphate decarboxylase [Striga asiatica]|uniref:Orotidine 5'-phosphate decarboxylase n=1 Tax=Striga asiatica TaxID=4170 RepID=A0A5A7RBR5_STRAF|nr:orotidine 5'-phosphate decarboxylase [Striga asiatica]